MADSMQHKLDRVRRPRVQITYDVETGGALQKVELPFVVGILADLSGQPKEPLKPFKDRKAVNIDRDNFNDVLSRATPRVAAKVDNRLADDGSKLAVELNFKSMDDFEPARVAQQVEPLRKLLEMRQELNQLLSKMEGNDKLEQLLGDVLANTEKAAAVAREIGGTSSAESVTKSAPVTPPKPAKKAPVQAEAKEKPSQPPPAKAKASVPAASPPEPEPIAEQPASEPEMDPELAAMLAQSDEGSHPEEPASTPEASAPAEEVDPELAALMKQMEEGS